MQKLFNKWQNKTLKKIYIFTQSQIIQDNNAIFNQAIFNQNIVIILDKINKIIIMKYNGPQKIINSRQRKFFR